MQILIGTPYVKIICVKEQLEIIQIPIGKLTSLKTFWGQTNALMIVNVMERERVVQMVGVKEQLENRLNSLKIVHIPIGKLMSLKTFWGRTNALMIVNVME